MTAVHVVQKLVEEIPAVAIPQMMMWVDDGQVGFEHRLVVLAQPVVIDREHAGAGPVSAANLGHDYLPPLCVLACIDSRKCPSCIGIGCLKPSCAAPRVRSSFLSLPGTGRVSEQSEPGWG
jgi:hypothetical protein